MSENNNHWNDEELLEVASRQKNVIWMFVLSGFASFIPFATIITGLILVYVIYKLASAVRSRIAWLYILLAFIPFVSLLAILNLSIKATRILRSNDIRVGFLGANLEDISPLKAAPTTWQCNECPYTVTENALSGDSLFCPECEGRLEAQP